MNDGEILKRIIKQVLVGGHGWDVHTRRKKNLVLHTMEFQMPCGCSVLLRLNLELVSGAAIKTTFHHLFRRAKSRNNFFHDSKMSAEFSLFDDMDIVVDQLKEAIRIVKTDAMRGLESDRHYASCGAIKRFPPRVAAIRKLRQYAKNHCDLKDYDWRRMMELVREREFSEFLKMLPDMKSVTRNEDIKGGAFGADVLNQTCMQSLRRDLSKFGLRFRCGGRYMTIRGDKKQGVRLDCKPRFIIEASIDGRRNVHTMPEAYDKLVSDITGFFT